MRERTMTFVAQELPTFSIKTLIHSSCKTYSISIMLGPSPLKLVLGPQVEKP